MPPETAAVEPRQGGASPDNGGGVRLFERLAAGRFEATAVFLLAFAARLPFLNHVPHKDELNHVLAARALLDRGTLEIVAGAGAYDRAWGFTYLVAGLFRVFGESLVVARMPAVFAGAALAAALYLWVRAEAGRVGGWVAALLMIFSPISLMLSQWARFYTIHALFFFTACALIYVVVTATIAPGRKRWLLGAAAAVCLVLAFHLQILTVVGVGGLGLWVLLMGLPHVFGPGRTPDQRRWAAVSLALFALLAAGAASWSGLVGWALGMASYVDLWAQGSSDQVRYYHYLFLERYPTLWTLFPLALVIAAATRWRATLLFACVFCVAFLVHSLVAWKTERYLFYVLPMFFGIWGIAVGGALPWLHSQTGRALEAAAGGPLAPRLQRTLITVVLVGVTLFAAFGNTAASYAVKMLTVGDAEWQHWGGYRGNPDWVAAGDALATEVTHADVVLGSYDVTAIYALDRLDYLLRRVGSSDGDLPDFATRSKSGVPIVSTPEALSRVMACHSSGLVFIERTHYEKEWSVTPELVSYLESNAERVVLPEEWRLFVYRWDQPVEEVDASCDTLPERPAAVAMTPGHGTARPADR